jgi:hypothetical protein
MTTGTLQQLVYLQHRRLEGRAVIVGAEHVSFSALETLAHAGASAAAMVTDHAHHQTFAAFRAGARLRFGTSLLTRTALSGIHGRKSVEGVTVRDLDTGAESRLECQLVVFSADWIPDHELAVLANIELDPGTRGPRVDFGARTTRPGVFAAGNLVHAAEQADRAALSGIRAAAQVYHYLAGEAWPTRTRLDCDSPLRWVSPNVITSASGAGLLLRSERELIDARLAASQDGRRLWTGRVRRIMPGRSVRIRSDWTAEVEVGGGPVTLRVLSSRARR